LRLTYHSLWQVLIHDYHVVAAQKFFNKLQISCPKSHPLAEWRPLQLSKTAFSSPFPSPNANATLRHDVRLVARFWPCEGRYDCVEGDAAPVHNRCKMMRLRFYAPVFSATVIFVYLCTCECVLRDVRFVHSVLKIK